MANANSTNNFGVTNFIVDPVAGKGTHTTVASALADASSGIDIFIRPGTYTENLTLKAGVNISAFSSDLFGQVTIIGKCTMTTAGSVAISNVLLQTNSDYFLAITGSAGSVVSLNSCYLNCSNNTGISYTSSSGSSAVILNECQGNLATTGIALVVGTGQGTIQMNYVLMANSGASALASSTSACLMTIYYCSLPFPITTSGTGGVSAISSYINSFQTNSVGVTNGGSGSAQLLSCFINSGTNSAITIATGLTLSAYNTTLVSSNVGVVAGLGTFNWTGTLFPGSSSALTVSNASIGVFDGRNYKGLTAGSPVATCLGERVSTTVPGASAVSLTDSTPATIASIVLTSGVWDISFVCSFGTGGALTSTLIKAGISTGDNAFTGAVVGDNTIVASGTLVSATADFALVIPAYRVTSSGTYYMVAQGNFTVGTLAAYGRISAVRVG